MIHRRYGSGGERVACVSSASEGALPKCIRFVPRTFEIKRTVRFDRRHSTESTPRTAFELDARRAPA